MTQTSTESAPKIAFTVEVPIPLEFLNDILCTAFEGGINYWCGSANLMRGTRETAVTDADTYTPDGFEYELFDAHDGKSYSEKKEDFPNYVPLTLQSLRKGLALYFLRGNPYGEVLDAGNYDAAEADLVVQLSVFGEIIYG